MHTNGLPHAIAAPLSLSVYLNSLCKALRRCCPPLPLPQLPLHLRSSHAILGEVKQLEPRQSTDSLRDGACDVVGLQFYAHKAAAE